MNNSLYNTKYVAISKRLRLMRLAAELTQQQLAKELGVGQSYISKIERGENFIDVMLFVRWCLACQETPGALLDSLFVIKQAGELS